MSARLRPSLACVFLATIAPLSGQSQATKPPPHGTAVVRPLSLSTGSTPELQAVADTTRAHIVLRLKAEGVVIVDLSRRLRGAELNKFVAAHFAIFGVAGIVDSQFVVVARLASMDTGDSLAQIRLAGPPASAAVLGDSLGTLFAPTILGRPLAER
jgi:hypothetical protein